MRLCAHTALSRRPAKLRMATSPLLGAGKNGYSRVRYENHRRLPARTDRARPAEFLYRPFGAAAEFAAAHARARAICQRRQPAAHGPCRLRALAARACPHRRHRSRGGKDCTGRDRGGHRRGTCSGDHAMGRRAHASQGPEIGAAARRSPSSAPAGRARPSPPWWRRRARKRKTAASWWRSLTRNCRRLPMPKPRSIPIRR